MANQFRVLLTAAAYILFQTLQARARGTACVDAQVSQHAARSVPRPPNLRVAVAQACRVGAALGAADRAASAHQLSLALRLAKNRPRRLAG